MHKNQIYIFIYKQINIHIFVFIFFYILIYIYICIYIISNSVKPDEFFSMRRCNLIHLDYLRAATNDPQHGTSAPPRHGVLALCFGVARTAASRRIELICMCIYIIYTTKLSNIYIDNGPIYIYIYSRILGPPKAGHKNRHRFVIKISIFDVLDFFQSVECVLAFLVYLVQ